MKPSLPNSLRWLAVLPGAIIGGFLAPFPLHWVLYATFVKGSVFSEMNIDSVERFFTPIAFTLGFVLAGSYIAPTHKFKTAIALSAVFAVFNILLLILFPEKVIFDLRIVVPFLGLLLGLFVAWKYYK